MKSVVIYYSFGGSTHKEARRLAAERGCPLYRVEEVRDRSLLTAFVPGGFLARRRRAVPIKPLACDLNAYDRVIIGCPVWAGYPAPAFNAVAALLPPGKEVELFFCSGGGDKQQSEPGTKELIEKKHCTVVAYRDIPTHVPPGKQKD